MKSIKKKKKYVNTNNIIIIYYNLLKIKYIQLELIDTTLFYV